MASVLGFALTLRRIGDLDDHQRIMVDRIVHNAQRLERVLSDVFDLNRLAVAELQPEPSRVDLVELVDEVRTSLDGPATERIVHHREGAVCAWADRVMLERVVHNLLVNAIEHDPSDQVVDVRVRVDGEVCRLVVEDRGPGLPEGLQRRIFEPFLLGPDAAGAADPGTGIGLALVDRFVRANGGRVAAEDRPGGGARFTVTLPVPAPHVADAPAPAPLPKRRSSASEPPAADREGWQQLAVAAHELLNPLAIADGYAQLLLDAADHHPDEVPEFARRVVRNLELTRMVLQRLRDSEVDPNHLALETRRVDVGALVAETVEDLAVTVAASRPLEVEAPVGLVHTIADPARLRQVLFNLVSNAARYSPPGTPIELTVSNGGAALVEVRDHGSGLSAADVERFFVEHQRLRSGSRSAGLGLGLYVSRTIARAHGGDLRFEPASPTGSRFVLELPLVA